MKRLIRPRFLRKWRRSNLLPMAIVPRHMRIVIILFMVTFMVSCTGDGYYHKPTDKGVSIEPGRLVTTDFNKTYIGLDSTILILNTRTGNRIDTIKR